MPAVDNFPCTDILAVKRTHGRGERQGERPQGDPGRNQAKMFRTPSVVRFPVFHEHCLVCMSDRQESYLKGKLFNGLWR